MESNSGLRTIGKVTGVAATTAPVVRRMATDDELRANVSDFISSASHVIRDVAADRRLRRDMSRMISAAQDSRERVRQDLHPRGRGMFMLGIGMVLGVAAVAGAIAGALLYPRTRQTVLGAADQTMLRASATVHDIRERYTGDGTSSSESAVKAA
jgi:hypothetical protein